MKIPETSNPHFQHAFKKGYRMAMDGRSVDSMPSDFRKDMQLRMYFQEGWEQAVEDVKLAQAQTNAPDWRHRFTWFAIMVIGGIATALHIINLYETEQKEQQAIINGTLTGSDKSTTTPTVANQNIQQLSDHSLRLLSDNERTDIQLNKQEDKILQAANIPLEPIIKSSIIITQAKLSLKIENRQAVEIIESPVPKYVRQLHFFTEISNANNTKIYHRWRTENQILATIELDIKSNQYRTWSNKKLASAWQGQWYIEVLDENKQVIYRKPFIYGNK